jgi:hypothetical protein
MAALDYSINVHPFLTTISNYVPPNIVSLIVEYTNKGTIPTCKCCHHLIILDDVRKLGKCANGCIFHQKCYRSDNQYCKLCKQICSVCEKVDVSKKMMQCFYCTAVLHIKCCEITYCCKSSICLYAYREQSAHTIDDIRYNRHYADDYVYNGPWVSWLSEFQR